MILKLNNMKRLFTRKEAELLIKQHNIFKFLTAKQIFKIIWWDFFNTKKCDMFLQNLKIGKTVKYSFIDANNIKLK